MGSSRSSTAATSDALVADGWGGAAVLADGRFRSSAPEGWRRFASGVTWSLYGADGASPEDVDAVLSGGSGFSTSLGPFLLASIDPDGALRLWSDPVGRYRVHYVLEPGRVYFGADPRDVQRRVGRLPRPDLETAARWMESRPAAPGRTGWQDMRVVEAGQVLRIDRSGAQLRRVFSPHGLTRRSLADVVSAVGAGLERSTRQAAQRGPLVALTSGGLDSSGIVASLNGQGIPFSSVAARFPGQAHDEAGRASPLLTGSVAAYREVFPAARAIPAGVSARSPWFPHWSYEALLGPALDAAASLGRVVLAGNGGDTLWSLRHDDHTSAVLTGDLSLLHWRLARRDPRGALVASVEALAAHGLGEPAAQWRWRHQRTENAWQAGTLLRQSYVNQLYAPVADARGGGLADAVTSGTLAVQAENIRYLALSRGLEAWLPWLHDDIISAALAVDPRDLRRGRYDRWPQRLALAGRIPPTIAFRANKASLAPLYRRCLMRWSGEALARAPETVEAVSDVVDIDRFREALARPNADEATAWRVWSAVAFGVWRQSLADVDPPADA